MAKTNPRDTTPSSTPFSIQLLHFLSKKTIKLQKKKSREHPLTLNEAAKHEGDEAGWWTGGWLQQAATATAVGDGGTGSVERMEARGPRDAHTPFRRRRIKHHCSIKHHTLDGDWGWEVSDSGRCFLAPDASLLQAAFVVPACGHPFSLNRLSLDSRRARGLNSIRFDSTVRFVKLIGRWLFQDRGCVTDRWLGMTPTIVQGCIFFFLNWRKNDEGRWMMRWSYCSFHVTLKIAQVFSTLCYILFFFLSFFFSVLLSLLEGLDDIAFLCCEIVLWETVVLSKIDGTNCVFSFSFSLSLFFLGWNIRYRRNAIRPQKKFARNLIFLEFDWIGVSLSFV